jgi:hypothetical protein
MEITEKHIVYYIENKVENNEKIKIQKYYMNMNSGNIQVFYMKIKDKNNTDIEKDRYGFTVLSQNINFLIINKKDILKHIRKQKINNLIDENN